MVENRLPMPTILSFPQEIRLMRMVACPHAAFRLSSRIPLHQHHLITRSLGCLTSLPPDRSRRLLWCCAQTGGRCSAPACSTRSEEHTSELQSLRHLVCRL